MMGFCLYNNVAVAAATTAAYSDNCTSQKKTIATRKQTQNLYGNQNLTARSS